MVLHFPGPLLSQLPLPSGGRILRFPLVPLLGAQILPGLVPLGVPQLQGEIWGRVRCCSPHLAGVPHPGPEGSDPSDAPTLGVSGACPSLQHPCGWVLSGSWRGLRSPRHPWGSPSRAVSPPVAPHTRPLVLQQGHYAHPQDSWCPGLPQGVEGWGALGVQRAALGAACLADVLPRGLLCAQTGGR